MRLLLLTLFCVVGTYAQTTTALPGQGMFLPHVPYTVLVGSTGINIQTWGMANATGAKMSMCGFVFFQTHTGTKAIQRVGFKWGSIIKSGGSGLTLSLQDMETTVAGGVMRADGVKDQEVAIPNSDSAFVLNGWYRSSSFSANRSVTFGDSLCVVLEYDASGWHTPDTVLLQGLEAPSVSQLYHSIQNSIMSSAGVWTGQTTSLPNLVLEFSDGTFGTLDQAFPVFNATNIHTFNSGSATNEYGLEFIPEVSGSIDMLWTLVMTAGSTSDYELNLYDPAGKVIGTATVDANTTAASTGNNERWVLRPVTQVDIVAGQTYRLGIKALTANSISVYSYDVQDANHFTVHSGGVNWKYTTRTGLGAWNAATATRRLIAGIRMSAIAAGSGGGGTSGSISMQ